MKKMISGKPSEQGVTLTGLLISLVIVGLLATAVFTFFFGVIQSINQVSATEQMWQRGRQAMMIMREAIESAGYGIPSFSQCPDGVDSINDPSGSPSALLPINASIQSSGYTTGSPYMFSTIIGGGSFGNAPATTINSSEGSNIKVASTANLNPGDLALLVPQSSGTCLFGQMTNIAGKGTLSTSSCTVSGKGKSKGSGTVVFNSGGNACFQVGSGSFFNVGGSSTASSLVGGDLYDLGSNDFLYQTFQIMENPAGSTPTLYMTQYTGAQSTAPSPQALASGVVDMQLEYGIGTNGKVQQWIAPSAYQPATMSPVMAVQLAMLIRASRYLPNQTSPSSFQVLNNTYTVPTSNGPGCFGGDCQHYAYHLFQSVIPVRNGIWQQG